MGSGPLLRAAEGQTDPPATTLVQHIASGLPRKRPTAASRRGHKERRHCVPTADQQRPYGPQPGSAAHTRAGARRGPLAPSSPAKRSAAAPQPECAGSGPAPAPRGLSPCSPPACPCSGKLTQPGATARVKALRARASAPLQRRHPSAFSRLPRGRRRRTARGQGTIPASQRRTAGRSATTPECGVHSGQPEPAHWQEKPTDRAYTSASGAGVSNPS